MASTNDEAKRAARMASTNDESKRAARMARANDEQPRDDEFRRRSAPEAMTGGPPLPAPYANYLRCFARGEYFQAHEVLEQAWREGRSGFYKGLILLASAWVHAARGNAHGVAAQLAKAARELAPYAPAYLGQDVAALLEVTRRGEAYARALRSERAASGAGTTGEGSIPLPPPDLTPDAGRFRGDEPELGG